MLGNITIYWDNQQYLVPTIYVYFVRKQYIALRNCMSAVWTYFGLSPDRAGKPENKEKAACQLCKKNFYQRDKTTRIIYVCITQRTQPAFLDTFVATSNNARKVLKGGER